MKNIWRWTLVGVCLCAAILVGVVVYFWTWLHAPLSLMPSQQHITVVAGENATTVARRLHQADTLKWPLVWRVYARVFANKPIKIGEFVIDPKASPIDILEKIQSNDVISYQLTLVEGLRFQDYVAQLAQHEKIDATLSGLSELEQLAALDLGIEHPEGWFYPDTYQFTADTSDIEILRTAHQKMQLVLDQQWQTREIGLPYGSPYEALIMASIVEKETGVASERAEIAGVFVRRLRLGMRLQTDPTVIYGLGSDYDGNIKRKHLKLATPYNTYVIKGLPPTPIANPGRAAIAAALNPLPGKTLYFVGRGDGTHQFSETLEEHNRAVYRYQKANRAKEYRSSPSRP